MTVFTPNLWKSTVLFQLTLSGRNLFLTPHMGLFFFDPRDYQCLTDSIRSSCYCNGIQFCHEKSYNQTLYCGSIWAKLKEISTTQWAVADFFSAIISEEKWSMNSTRKNPSSFLETRIFFFAYRNYRYLLGYEYEFISNLQKNIIESISIDDRSSVHFCTQLELPFDTFK